MSASEATNCSGLHGRIAASEQSALHALHSTGANDRLGWSGPGHRPSTHSAMFICLAVLLWGCGATQLSSTSTGTSEVTAMQQTRSGAVRLTPEWDKTFRKSDKVDHQKVTFKNRYGITLAADLYLPKNRAGGRLPALAVSGPFGAVKEQVSGLYAQTMAERGFAALAIDPSYTGESSGEPRNVASPDINTEDVSAAVDFLGLHEAVDRNRIGALGICGYSGMSLTAATSDARIKAVATVSMYAMSRSMSRGYRDSYTAEQRRKVIDYICAQRWADAEHGTYAAGPHEVQFDDKGDIVSSTRVLPETLPATADPVTTAFFNYFRTKRGFHSRSVNSAAAWTATTPMSFFNFPMYANIHMISRRPILLVAGEK